VLYSLGEKSAELGEGVYIAPSADVIGWVRLRAGSSVWFNVVLRGDSDWIEVGEGSNVQDGTVIHTDPGVPVVIGPGVTIGHMAFLHACTIGEGSMVANGAMVMDRVRVGRHCVIGAGTLIPPDKEIPDGSVVMGSPYKIVRETSSRDLAMIARAGESYRHRARSYKEQLRPDPRA